MFPKKSFLLLFIVFFYAAPVSGMVLPLIEPKPGLPASQCQTGEQSLHLMVTDHDADRMEKARNLMRYMKQSGMDPGIALSLYKASIRTNVNFELLTLKALMESDLGRFNKAANSSAEGVFQYIVPTWLALIKRYGGDIGYPHYAKTAYNPHMRAEILALRHNADTAALIKAYQVREETALLESYKKGPVTATDHYISHMLGLSLAKEFYKLKEYNSIFVLARSRNPAMREASKLNRHFFFDKTIPLTAAASYRKFEARVARDIQRMRLMSSLQQASKPSECVTN